MLSHFLLPFEMLLNNFLFSKNEQETCHNRYTCHADLAGNLNLVSIVCCASVPSPSLAGETILFLSRLCIEILYK